MTHDDMGTPPLDTLVVPKLWRADGRICWRPGKPGRAPGDLSRALFDFANLRSVSDAAGFAARFGPLYLCAEHGEFAMHSRPRLCAPRHRGSGAALEFWEPLADVLAWAARARALIGISERTKSGAAVGEDEWLSAGVRIAQPASAGTDSPFSVVRLAVPTAGVDSLRLISGQVNYWLKMGAPTPFLALHNGRLELQFGSGDGQVTPPAGIDAAVSQIYGGGLLWAVLGLQLASQIGGGLGWTTCSACGKFFRPKRVPAPGRYRFCAECGTRAAWRLAQRKRRGKEA